MKQKLAKPVLTDQLKKEAELVAKELVAKAAIEAAKIIDTASSHVTSISLMSKDISYMRADITEIKEVLNAKYVTKEQFAPVQKVVYTVTGALGLAIIAAIVKLIFKI